VCAEIDTEALAVMVVNRLRGTAPGVAVQLTLPPAERRELLEDLALATGAHVLGPASGTSPSAVRDEHLGRAQRVTASREATTVLRGGGRLEVIRARRAELERELREAPHGVREALHERIARLAGVVAVLRVGAPTDVEREARRAQVEDALAATRAAAEEGIVPGGGVALLRAAMAMDALELRVPERAGRDIVAAALAEPARQIAVNAGAEGESVLARLRSGGSWYGFDAVTGTFGELDRAGIVDPAKVARCALLHAGGLGGLVLTTDALVVDDGPGEAPKAD
jgi:chaperonin GroEL